MNTLFSSGQNVQIAVGQSYLSKDFEVMINNTIYRKSDLEITINNHDSNSEPIDVKVGIRLRKGAMSLPASMKNYTKWQVNSITQTSISALVENINTSIK